MENSLSSTQKEISARRIEERNRMRKEKQGANSVLRQRKEA